MTANTKEQLQGIIDNLKPTHTLPRDPEGGFWLDIQDAIVDAYSKHAQEHGVRGGQAIIMAGPPGAGKSQAVATAREAAGPQAQTLGLTEEGFITIDADDIKQVLLGNPVPGLNVNPELVTQARQHWEKTIADHAPGNLADGKPVLRGELSTLVHGLSTETADRVRGELLEESFNVKIEGTLQWMESPDVGQGPTLVRELEAARYSHVTVVAVDSPRELCLEGAARRWEQPRARGDQTARYTPDDAINHMFEGETSRCIDNAKTTHELARAALAKADLIVVDRSNTPPRVEHTNPRGHTQTLTNTPAPATPQLSAIVLASQPTIGTPTKPTTTRHAAPRAGLGPHPTKPRGPRR